MSYSAKLREPRAECCSGLFLFLFLLVVVVVFVCVCVTWNIPFYTVIQNVSPSAELRQWQISPHSFDLPSKDHGSEFTSFNIQILFTFSIFLFVCFISWLFKLSVLNLAACSELD